MSGSAGPEKKPAPRKRAPRKNEAASEAPSHLTLDYQLAELPSAQHRAGLAGLVLMLKRLERLSGEKRGRAHITRLEDAGASVELDLEGLQRLFDELYAAGREERGESKPRDGQPPLREEERESKDEKGKVRLKRYFIYEVTVPRAGLLLDADPTSNGRTGHWVKLWRDMLWQTLRGVPATRGPFEARAEGKPTTDAQDAWKALVRADSTSVPLSSTDYLGAMERTADNVPFADRARFQFLLHFWPYIAQVYVPHVLEMKDGRNDRKSVGYALAIPDVARLETFCEELPQVLAGRGVEVLGFRPKEALVDLAVESALKMSGLLRARLARREGSKATSDLVLGYEVFHLDKDGNNVRTYSASRIEPDSSMVDEYEGLQPMLWDPLFRRTRLLNLVAHRPWYSGFDRIAATVPYASTFGATAFRHDARESFKRNEAMSQSETSATPEAAIEPLVLQLVRGYVGRKVKNRTKLDWDSVKDQPRQRQEYEEARERIARDAFLAVRSRSGQDFVQYFAGTLCSVPHHLKTEQFVLLSRALHERTEEVRTLTLLALSAVG